MTTCGPTPGSTSRPPRAETLLAQATPSASGVSGPTSRPPEAEPLLAPSPSVERTHSVEQEEPMHYIARRVRAARKLKAGLAKRSTRAPLSLRRHPDGQ